jgi:hypothetical protein
MENVLLVVLGWVLALGPDWYRRKRMRKAHWEMLGAEISICTKRAKWYINRTVIAPLYRLPTSAFSVSFPVLVSEADVTGDEFASLVEYYSWAEDINRGLDNASDAAKADDSIRLLNEEARIHSKCEELLSQYLEPALKTLRDHGVSPN